MNNTNSNLVKETELVGRGMVFRCSDCDRWVDVEYGADTIRHDKRCDFHDEVEAEAAPQPARGHTRAAVARAIAGSGLHAEYTDDQILDLHRAGLISDSEAMNESY